MRTTGGCISRAWHMANGWQTLERVQPQQPSQARQIDFLNSLATNLVFIIALVNIFITAFSIQKPVVDLVPGSGLMPSLCWPQPHKPQELPQPWATCLCTAPLRTPEPGLDRRILASVSPAPSVAPPP
ncbi:Ninjurin-1 [Myotis davidii]|uniref:Ninjurin-1 n=1 Tax=Myotis davidii TaxID=225400 RepID=L5M5R0_MYODS|nr:Ninjurin-1 [Myotis davidii]